MYSQYSKIRASVKLFSKTMDAVDDLLATKNENAVAEKSAFIRLRFHKMKKYIPTLALAAKRLYWVYNNLWEEIEALEKTKKRIYNEIIRYQEAKAGRQKEAYFSPEEEKEIREEIKQKQSFLVHKKAQVDKMEQEYLIKQDELEIAIRETNLARSSYYRLTDTEMELFEKQRPLILEGVEKHGSISLAIKNNAKITMRPSSILHYAKKHKQFGEDLQIAMQVFKDSLDATVTDRAINGTVNPVFQRGEYIGDYAIKDNKLLVELAKAKLPEQYNPRLYASANPQTSNGTTINILSFDGVDETKKGYARNIGVVKSVDDSGRVERITQAKKMIEFYQNKKDTTLPDSPETNSHVVAIIQNDGTHELDTSILDADEYKVIPNEIEEA